MSNRPGLGNFFSNWSKSDLPLTEKVRAVLRNNWTKGVNRTHCCGNHGEPGC